MYRQNWLPGLFLALALLPLSGFGMDKPTGAPLELSTIETEQSVPLAIVSPDGKSVSCVTIRIHWNPKSDVGPDDDATSFTLDIGSDSPGASIFIAQLWNASLASAQAWQQPWGGARWKILQTPATDGSGIDAGLAVGMIATSARRPYPKETLVIGSLNPDGSLGPVSRLSERIDAAAAAGITRVIIPSIQRFDTDTSGQVINIMTHASDLHLECVPVDNLVDATQTTMNDPLPEVAVDSSAPKYSNDVATYIDGFAHREQNEVASGLKFAPKESELPKYAPRTAAIWKSVYADNDAGQQAYRAGQVYVAYQLFARANGRMRGVNALVGQNKATFNIQSALAESDDLRRRLHDLMTPPSIDRAELESAVLVAEMADWAYDISASLEGAELIAKQAYSQRSDATDTQKDRARETILFVNEQAKYLINQSDFYTGLILHIGHNNPMPVDDNASNLLPQLIPAQLATARIFTEGIRQRANDLRDGLLFDPRLAAYMRILRESKTAWDSRQRQKEIEGVSEITAGGAPAKLGGSSPSTVVGFDPGNTYLPPHTVLAPSANSSTKKLSDVALCLIWANDDCEIATLDEKYLRLNGTVDPVTHEWQVKDRAKLDALLQSAELGARRGIAFAEKVEVDPSVLSMIYEKTAYLRIQNDDASALDALRNYWRCALIGNLCWQLAHTHKAKPVEAANTAAPGKPSTDGDKKPDDKQPAKTEDKPNVTVTVTTDKPAPASDKPVPAPDKPNPPEATPAVTNDTLVVAPPPPATNQVDDPKPPPRALPVTDDTDTTNAPPMPPVPPAPPANTEADKEAKAPAADKDKNKGEDYTGMGNDSPADTATTTNAAPVIGPVPPVGPETGTTKP